jgi:hypothetical protein
MRRQAPWRLLAVAGVLVSLGAALTLALPHRCPVTEAALGRVKEGMTRAETEEILGGPPGDYRGVPEGSNAFSLSYHSPEVWFGDEGTALVRFDAGVVGYARFARYDRAPVTNYQALWWRFHGWMSRWLP